MAHEYHDPVLLHDCVNGLALRPDGVYVDATFGGGGHSRAILEELGPDGALIAFDRDADAARNAPDDPRFKLVRSDFRWIKNHLRHLGRLPVDGLLADLGVSSHQFDTGDRGFSFRHDGPLDMRMDRRAKRTAATVIATSSEEELATMLREFGEVPGAHRVARRLVQARSDGPIRSTKDLADVLAPLVPRRGGSGFLAQVFQALRIAVNDELGSLRQLLQVSAQVLRPGGRLVIISYHSLEDRSVKHWMRSGDLEGRERTDLYGERIRPFRPLTSKAIRPTEEEMERNPRARSARARIAERI
ncbi:MAG: 16S rRNA (cytosine(1402)-N(4))-methyltransferase RsmH [Flavobacteriales bacterium]|nr:16S rRNA (cytosine(1402)-N(4))-methyltransferase RsmH [Flavobacteriales bacterium]MCB9166680.1 16S rRNA (cytosine(1402)-N(4))-methyltransferase RsmH [Flavobacteriales bacterium]